MRKFLLSIILICVLVAPALAHPGGTDTYGGHYDHSTGEYHYHHGYPPHDHEDLDGDGILDCPHNFKDKAGESSGQSSGSVTRYPTPTRPPSPPAPTVAEPEQEGGLKTAWEVVKVVGVLAIGFFVAAFAGMALSAPVIAIRLAFVWLRDRFRKPGKEPEWKPSPQRIPGKQPQLPQTVEQLSIFEEPEPERTGDPDTLIWKSAYDEMKHTRITDRYIHIQDLECVANYFAVDNDTALQLLNDDRIHSGMPPLELLKA